MSSDLYPCPFCGSHEWEGEKQRLSVVSDHSSHVVYCLCGSSGPVKDTKEEAIAAWNNREGCDRQPGWNPFRVGGNGVGVSLKGSLESMEISTILQILSLDQKTGILRFTRGQQKGAICFRNGQIVAASGDQWKRLGDILFSTGLIAAEELEGAAETAKSSGRRLGEVLLDLGYIDQETLRELVRLQIHEAVLDLFFWREGQFEYQDCEVDIDQRAIGEVNIMELILRGASQVDESKTDRKNAPWQADQDRPVMGTNEDPPLRQE
jgi:Lar family restriction alleviation protein